MIINETEFTDEEVQKLKDAGLDFIEQGSEEWHEERLGRATASRALDIIKRVYKTKANPNGRPSAGFYNYVNELVAERLTGKSKRFSTRAMNWGSEHEEEAARIYEETTGREVRECGFVVIEDMEAGASPDRLVDNDGLLEIKCPNTDTHIGYVTDGPPEQYVAQMQFQMWATKRQWTDFMSYDPEIDGPASVYITRVERDDEMIDEIARCTQELLALVDKKEQQLR